MAQYELSIGSGEFWARAAQDIAVARRRVLIQAMTWEGDAAGLPVAQALSQSAAHDRRALVDDYSRHVLNDTFLSLSRDPALMAEAQTTWAMFDGLLATGVGVRVTNPIGRNPLNYPKRNHKKLLVMDDIAWIGGINFSDHNFAWHDMMLRVQDAALADWLVGQFDADWRGEPAFARSSFPGGITLLSLDGATNSAGFSAIMDVFDGANRSIEVVSAYPTEPFMGAFARAAARGVAVTIHTPRPNNKPIVRDYLLGFAPRHDITLRLLPDMTHVKAALVDDEVLLLGSTNFDFVSYRLNNDYAAIIRNRALVTDFERLLLEPARQAGLTPLPGEGDGWRAAKAAAMLGAAEALITPMAHHARIMEWRRP